MAPTTFGRRDHPFDDTTTFPLLGERCAPAPLLSRAQAMGLLGLEHRGRVHLQWPTALLTSVGPRSGFTWSSNVHSSDRPFPGIGACFVVARANETNIIRNVAHGSVMSFVVSAYRDDSRVR
jgi:hypothetical protein